MLHQTCNALRYAYLANCTTLTVSASVSSTTVSGTFVFTGDLNDRPAFEADDGTALRFYYADSRRNLGEKKDEGNVSRNDTWYLVTYATRAHVVGQQRRPTLVIKRAIGVVLTRKTFCTRITAVFVVELSQSERT